MSTIATGPRSFDEFAAWPLDCQSVRGSATEGISVPAFRRILHLERAAAARKRRVGHEISVRGESIGVLGMRITDIAPVRLHIPALRLVFQLRHHDLVKDLLMDRGILDGN